MPHVKLDTSFRDLLRTLSNNELRVLLILGLHINGDSMAWPSVGRIAEETALGTRTVQRTIKRLQRMGLVAVGCQVGGRGRAAEYVVTNYFVYGDKRVSQLCHPFDEATPNLTPPKGCHLGSKKGDRALSPQEEPLRRRKINRSLNTFLSKEGRKQYLYEYGYLLQDKPRRVK